MTFIYRFVRSIPYDHPVCFLDGHVKIFVSWMASLSRAPPSASAGASFFSFPGRDLVPGSFGLVPGSAFAFAFAFERTDQRAPLAVCSAPDPPSASAGASFYPISLDVVGSSRSRRRVFRSGSRLRLRLIAFSALVSLCVRRQIHQVPAQVLLSTPAPWTSSVRRDLVPVSAFAFARSWAPPDQAPAVDNSKATAATESPLATCQGHVQ